MLGLRNRHQLGKKVKAVVADNILPVATNRLAAFAPARERLVLVLVVLLLSASASAAEEQLNTVALKSEALLPGPTITLADVAEVSGPRAAELQAVDLGPVPWPGTKRLIDGTVLKIKLYREKFDLMNITISGEGCVVTTKTIKVSGKQITQAAQELLLAKLQWPAEDTEITITEEPEDQEIAAGTGKPLLEARLAGGIADNGDARVVVTGKCEGISVFRTSIHFQVNAFAEVLVARRDIHQGENFNEQNTVRKRLNVTAYGSASGGRASEPGDLFSDAAALTDAKAARTIRMGTPITRQQVVIPPIVEKDDLVQIIFQTEYISLSARGIARQAGAPGDMVRVENLDSKREVVGKVLPDGSISVAF